MYAAGGNGIMAIVSFIASIFVVKNLGPSEFGILQEMTAYFLIIQNFENIVNPNIFKRKILEDPGCTHGLVLTHGVFIVVIGSFFTLASLLVYFVFGLPAKFLILSVMLSAMLFRYSNGISFAFDAELKTVKGQISLNVGNGIASIGKVVASYLNPIAFTQSFMMPLQYATTMIVHIWQYRKVSRYQGVSTLRVREYATLVRSSFALFLSTFVDLVQGRLPFIYLGATVTASQVGIFSAGVKLTEPWLFVASALSISFWPKLVSTQKESPDKFRETLILYFSTVFYFFAAIAASVLFMGPFLVHHVLGEKYAASGVIFQIQAVALLFQALNVALGIVEISRGLTMISLFRNLISLAINFTILLTAVPRIGIIGASIAITSANFAACVICPLFFRPTREIIKVMLASIVLGPKLLVLRLR